MRARPADELSVVGIECFAHHGVLADERRDGQPFIVDLTLAFDTRPAAGSDDLRDTVDYGRVAAEVKSVVEADPADLVETVAERIAAVCLADHRVDWARVTLHKPKAPIQAAFSDVRLTITRKREGPSD